MNHLPPTIAVVGLGYVGLPLACLASRKGYRVLGIDINQEKIKRLREGVLPFADAELGPPGANTRKFTVSQNYFLITDLQKPWIMISGTYGAAKEGSPTTRA